MKIPINPIYFFLNRKVGVIPLLNLSKQYTNINGTQPLLQSQMNRFGDCFFTTEMTKDTTIQFLKNNNIDIRHCQFLTKKPSILEIYYDRISS